MKLAGVANGYAEKANEYALNGDLKADEASDLAKAANRLALIALCLTEGNSVRSTEKASLLVRAIANQRHG